MATNPARADPADEFDRFAALAKRILTTPKGDLVKESTKPKPPTKIKKPK